MNKVNLLFIQAILSLMVIMSFDSCSEESKYVQDEPTFSSALNDYAQKCDYIIGQLERNEISLEDFETKTRLQEKEFATLVINEHINMQINDSSFIGTRGFVNKVSNNNESNTTPTNNTTPGEDPYVVNIKSKQEQILDDIKSKSSVTFYNLSCEAVYLNNISWSCKDISSSTMQDYEKYIMIECKKLLIEQKQRTTVVEIDKDSLMKQYMSNKEYNISKVSKNVQLSTKQKKDYYLCAWGMFEAMGTCTGTFLICELGEMLAYAAGVIASGGTLTPGAVYAFFISLGVNGGIAVQCYSQARGDANRCLLDHNIPSSYHF